MKLADQLKQKIELKRVLKQLEDEIVEGHETVFVQASEKILDKLRDEGFEVNTDGIQYNGGGYVSLKQSTQWSDH